MEKLANIGWYFRWTRGTKQHVNDDRAKIQHSKDYENLPRDLETTKDPFTIIESILLWENSVNSISVVVVFNILFWSIVVLEVRSFAAASSAALVVVLGYSTLENQIENEHKPSNTIKSPPKPQKIRSIINKMKCSFDGLKLIRKHNPGTFCTGVCILSIILWLIGRTINSILFTYVLCMSILMGPVLLSKIPKKAFSTKEWDNGIDEFLPTVTEDNFDVLKRAGEMGDHSPTPPSRSLDDQIDPFNDDELIGLKMPSHEDGSTDGLELSELELSCGETDVIDIKIQNRHFEGDSSSDDDVEHQLKLKDLSDNISDDSECEFEIIDSHEINEKYSNTENI